MKLYTREELNTYPLSLTYDDLSLVPTEISRIKSRTEPVTKVRFLGYDLGLPVISSPMDTVSGINMCNELDRLGCLGILNRFDSSLKEFSSTSLKDNKIKAAAVSLKTDEELLSGIREKCDIICIDTANASNNEVLSKCEEIKSRFDFKVIVGNIANGLMLQQLVDAGADAVRVGIGGGSVCTTSIQTGIGIGQASSVLDVVQQRQEKKINISVIADGGIKSPGDAAKALALGADVVMLGRMLAGTKETPGEIIKYNDQLWKKYRGSASFGVKMKGEFIEGEETMVAYKGAVGNVINSISDGLRSALSYMNCMTIAELQQKAAFAVLSNSSFLERLPKK